MAIQYSVAVRNAKGDAMEVAIGTSPKLQVRTGAQPANCAAAASGTLLVEIPLPSDWLNAGSSGAKTLLGTWNANAVATGAPGHYRLVDNAGTTCHEQGTCTVNSGGGDLDIAVSGGGSNITSGGAVSVTTWTRTEGNA